MAKLNFKYGLLANLPAYSAETEGTILIATDERAAYVNIGGAQIRLGDFQTFDTLADLKKNANKSTSALYFVKDLNVLARYDGSDFVQINTDTGATSVESTGTGNLITDISYDAATRKITFTKGETVATSAELGTLKDTVGTEAVPAKGNVGDADYEAAKEATGLIKDIRDLETLVGSDSVADQIDDAIDALGGSASQTAGTDGLALTVTSENGEVKSISGSIAANTYDAYGAASDVQGSTTETVASVDAKITTLNSDVSTEGSILKSIKDNAKDATYSDDGKGNVVTIAGAIAAAQSSAISGSAVTVEKQDSAETGFASTYVVKQNGTQVGVKINIPKDYLVKSGTLESCTTADSPVTGLKVGDKYLDFVVNTVGNDETAQHIYLPVNDLFDSYTSGSASTDAIVVTVDNTTNKISAAITDATIGRAKIDADFEADIAALEGTHAVDGTSLKSVSTQIKEEAKNAVYTEAVAESSVGAGDGKAEVTIKGAIDDIYNQLGTSGSVATQIKSAVEALDAEQTQTASADNGQLALSVTEVDGKITAISGSIAANTYDAYGAASDVLGSSSDTSSSNTVYGAKAYTDAALTWGTF